MKVNHQSDHERFLKELCAAREKNRDIFNRSFYAFWQLRKTTFRVHFLPFLAIIYTLTATVYCLLRAGDTLIKF